MSHGYHLYIQCVSRVRPITFYPARCKPPPLFTMSDSEAAKFRTIGGCHEANVLCMTSVGDSTQLDVYAKNVGNVNSFSCVVPWQISSHGEPVCCPPGDPHQNCEGARPMNSSHSGAHSTGGCQQPNVVCTTSGGDGKQLDIYYKDYSTDVIKSSLCAVPWKKSSRGDPICCPPGSEGDEMCKDTQLWSE